VSGDRVVWAGHDGASWQIFTRKLGADASPQQLTTDPHSHASPQVSGDRVVWYGNDGVQFQIFTRKIGVDASPVKLTDYPSHHGDPRVSGDRVVWYGERGTVIQIFRAKLITTPRVFRSPNRGTIAVRRKKHVARWTLSATFQDKDGTLVAGAKVYLQTSKNGKTKWTRTQYRLTTNGSGKVSKAFSSRTRKTVYYRWYFPEARGYTKAYSAKQKVVVR